jgi:hypothetical protein
MATAEDADGHDRYCGANKRQGEGTCHRPAGWGTDHPGAGRCKLHGGSTPDHKKAAKVELARRAVDTYGLPREVTPDVALLEEVHRTAGHVAWLAEVVAKIEHDDLVWGKTEEAEKTATEFSGVDTTYKAVPNIWLTLYQQERKHLAAVAKAAIDAGIAERQVRIAEQQGQMLAKVINRVLDALALTGEQKARVPEVVPQILRSISSAA